MFVAASKTGSEIVFEVADGKGPHTVIKSTDPSHFNPAAATLVEDGRYADRTNSGPVIVYYRVD
jgi:predicted class III extradiol MEMO1 family dioxygenase